MTTTTASPSRLRRWAMEIALVLPAFLLAVGWFLSSVREQQAIRDRERRELSSRTELIAAAVIEGLEELRAREDERPYYHYSYYFTPQELIAVQESVAISPLGRVSKDGRIFGHFQIDPGPRLTSPLLHPEASETAQRRGVDIVLRVRRTVDTALLNLVDDQIPRPRPDEPFGRQRAHTTENTIHNQQTYTHEILDEIRAAQRGNMLARRLLANRGRSPARNRVTVPIELQSLDLPQAADGEPISPATIKPDQGADVARYTPMTFLRAAGATLLYRVVTTDGASSLQGVLLDSDVLRGRWLQEVAERHAVPETPIEYVLSTRAPQMCVAHTPLAYPLEDLSVCASHFTYGSAQPLFWQLPALAIVLALIALSAASRRRALSRAEDLARTERAFVASVSHELRTPLTTLRMHAEMLQEGWVAADRRERVVRQLVDESTRLARLIDDVLTFGRLSENRAQLHLSDGDLSEKVANIVERERTRLEDRGVVLQLEGVESNVCARFDAAAVEQIVMNLLDNAAKYAASAPDRSVLLRVFTQGESAVIQVSDQGTGIPATEREKVFERFYRGREAVASHVAGTGLGLAIVRGLARAMGGNALVGLNPAGVSGCTLEVRLPRTAA